MLNYETVATFGNVPLEASNYNSLLKRFHAAAVHAEEASCYLNAGQAVSLAGGMALMLAGAAWGWGGSGALSCGWLSIETRLAAVLEGRSLDRRP